MPKLSIIVPVYNVEQYLQRCVESILAQTFEDFELILVDDGSNDRCPGMCDKFAKEDERIKVIHKKNGGVSDARNVGIDDAKGEFLAFVDSDDYIDKNMYNKMLETAERYNADVVVCAIEYISNESCSIWPVISGNIVYYKDDILNNFYPQLRFDIAASVWNKIYRREVFDKIRFPIEKKYEDSFVYLDILQESNKLVLIEDAFYKYYRCRPGSIMNGHYNETNFQKIDIALKWYSTFEKLGIKEQMLYALAHYAECYMENYFAVNFKYLELKDAFERYIRQFQKLLFRVFINRYIPKTMKLSIVFLYINKNYSLEICKRIFKQCVPDFLLDKNDL